MTAMTIERARLALAELLDRIEDHFTHDVRDDQYALERLQRDLTDLYERCGGRQPWPGAQRASTANITALPQHFARPSWLIASLEPSIGADAGDCPACGDLPDPAWPFPACPYHLGVQAAVLACRDHLLKAIDTLEE